MNATSKLRNLFIVLLIGLPFCLHAQQSRFSGGMLFNLNGISFTGSTTEYWNSTNGTVWGGLGISCGFFVKRAFSEKLYSTLELRYTNKGSVYEYTGRYGTKSLETLYVNYVEIPVLIGSSVKFNNKTYFIESGLAFAKRVSSNLHGSDLINRTDTPNASEFKKNDISWIGSLKFPLISKNQREFLFGLRVSHSILSIHSNYKMYHFDYGIEFNYVFD